jgi:SAM-dependent methyltransferase
MLSAECFEHNPFWVETFANMLRMTRPGGLVAFSCASTGRPEHGTARTGINMSPLTHAQGWDHYRNLDAEDFMNTFHLQGWFEYFHFLYSPRMFDLYFYGFRKGGTREIRVEPAQMLVALNQQIGAVRLACWAPALGLIRG